MWPSGKAPASTTIRAFSKPSVTSNSNIVLVTPGSRTPAPGAPVVTEVAIDGCAGPSGTSSAIENGTSSAASVGLATTGTRTEVAPGPVNTVTLGSSAKVGTLSGSLVVTRSTSL